MRMNQASKSCIKRQRSGVSAFRASEREDRTICRNGVSLGKTNEGVLQSARTRLDAIFSRGVEISKQKMALALLPQFDYIQNHTKYQPRDNNYLPLII